jgi:hypothetical protein
MLKFKQGISDSIRILAIQQELDEHARRQINSAVKSEMALEILPGRTC